MTQAMQQSDAIAELDELITPVGVPQTSQADQDDVDLEDFEETMKEKQVRMENVSYGLRCQIKDREYELSLHEGRRDHAYALAKKLEVAMQVMPGLATELDCDESSMYNVIKRKRDSALMSVHEEDALARRTRAQIRKLNVEVTISDAIARALEDVL